tara:strand:- start:956 stop:1804 length:849 start_codon:yes stop_codon:yes gene_type:complete
MFIDENSKPKEKLKAWYLFTEDFTAGTSHLTNEEIGVYIRLLCWNWNKRCIGLPKDLKIIKRIAGCYTQSEEISCEKILEQFFIEMPDHYQNERQLQEYLYIRKRIDASKINGALGGRPKKPSLNPPTSTPTSTSNKTTRGTKYNPLFNKFWDNITNKVSKGTAEKNFLKVDMDWIDKPEQLAKMYNDYYNSVDDKQFAKQPAFWLSAKKYLDEKPKKFENFGVADPYPLRKDMFVRAIEENKVTTFIINYANQHQGDVFRAVKEGHITREDAMNKLEVRGI